ncbi:MAG: hypothetical protein R3293_20910 [Candidatus Promineifilaceae bacterium]|nr:hypothetical protein [Candidatus Promineifilaceae bacterium]
MKQNGKAKDVDVPRQYQITIEGHLQSNWSEWFDNLMIQQESDGTTTLSGPITDRAALYGILNKLRDMGITLLSVQILTDKKK